jgi:hypothetical protein
MPFDRMKGPNFAIYYCKSDNPSIAIVSWEHWGVMAGDGLDGFWGDPISS